MPSAKSLNGVYVSPAKPVIVNVWALLASTGRRSRLSAGNGRKNLWFINWINTKTRPVDACHVILEHVQMRHYLQQRRRDHSNNFTPFETTRLSLADNCVWLHALTDLLRGGGWAGPDCPCMKRRVAPQHYQSMLLLTPSLTTRCDWALHPRRSAARIEVYPIVAGDYFSDAPARARPHEFMPQVSIFKIFSNSTVTNLNLPP